VWAATQGLAYTPYLLPWVPIQPSTHCFMQQTFIQHLPTCSKQDTGLQLEVTEMNKTQLLATRSSQSS
jgi:hypothetical protein